MNKRLKRCLNEEARLEKKIAELQAHLKDVRAARKQEEDLAILRSIRSMKLEKNELLKLLDGIQSGEVDILRIDDLIEEGSTGSTDAPVMEQQADNYSVASGAGAKGEAGSDYPEDELSDNTSDATTGTLYSGAPESEVDYVSQTNA